MDAERSAAWVRRWVGVYTRGLSEQVRRDRVDEIEDDLWSQLHDDATRDGRAGSLGGEIVARMVLGIPADLGWRLEQHGSTPSVAPARNPTKFARVISAMAVIGGVVWPAWLLPAMALGENAWTSPYWFVIFGCAVVASICLALALVALVFGNLDRLHPLPAILGGLGAAGGLLLAGEFWAGALVGLPVGSSAVMLDLARKGIIRARPARLHAGAGLLSAIPAYILIATNGAGGSGVVYVAFLVAFVVYGLSWIPIGWSLRDGGWISEAPEAQA